MRRIFLSLTPLALVAVSAGNALAQGMPTSQPKFLSIVREQVKTGRAADHAKWEAGWPAAYAKAKNPYNYIALVSVTGPSEAWYVSPYATQAAYGDAMSREDSDATLRGELDRLSRGDADFISESTVIQALARPDLSHGNFPDLAMMRIWEITTFRVKPGHDDDFAAAAKAWAAASARSAPNASWRTYEVVAGMPGPTFLVFSSYGSFGDFDKAATDGDATFKGVTFEERTALQKYSSDAALSTVSNRFRLDPVMSYVPQETRQKDAAFWMPKPATAPAAKAPAKKP
jgi:hypothetical protein